MPLCLRLYGISSILLLLMAGCKTSHSDTDDPVPEKKRNDQVAGEYTGVFSCASYQGPVIGWTHSEESGTLTLTAVGDDSLRLALSAGCLFNTYRFAWDSAGSIGKPYLLWKGNTPFGLLHSWADSVLVSVPRPSSYGWLNSIFEGKKK